MNTGSLGEGPFPLAAENKAQPVALFRTAAVPDYLQI